jgi:hypothetical protein
MSTPDPSPQHNATDWQLLTEFLVPALEETQVDFSDHVADVLRQLSLDPGQLDQILAAISQSLETLESTPTPLRLRISVSGVNLAGAMPAVNPQDNPESGHDPQQAGDGLGFFLVNRIVGQLQEQDPNRYRLVEVLLYCE